MENRCEWDERYPPESCITRVLHQFTLERMDKSAWQHTEYKPNPGQKPKTEAQKLKAKLAARKRANLESNSKYYREEMPDELPS
jgi:hypothetical protein